MGMTNYLESEILDHAFGEGGRDFTSPANLYLGLGGDALPIDSTQDSATFDEVTTPGSDGYSRQAISFDAAAGGAVVLDGAVTFGPCASTNWGTVNSWCIFDASTGGNELWRGNFDNPRSISIGESLQIADEGITLQID